MVQKYSTLPLEIEAIQLEESIDSIDEVLIFMGVSVDDQYRRTLIAATALRDGGLIIPTLEGEMKANFGDYIIKGVLGEYIQHNTAEDLVAREKIENTKLKTSVAITLSKPDTLKIDVSNERQLKAVYFKFDGIVEIKGSFRVSAYWDDVKEQIGSDHCALSPSNRGIIGSAFLLINEALVFDTYEHYFKIIN